MKIHRVLTNGAVVSLVLGTVAGVVWAGEVKNREENQQDRIAQGVKSGELTPKETAKIEKGEQKIENARKKALADGTMSGKEKAKLNKMENKESKKIYRSKHNARKA